MLPGKNTHDAKKTGTLMHSIFTFPSSYDNVKGNQAIDGVSNMDRLEAFENMLSDIQNQAAYESRKMEELKVAGKEKTATYRQYFGNRLFYKKMLDLYRKYGLI